MKSFVVLAFFVSCALAAPLKNELLERAAGLEKMLGHAVKELTDQHKEHLAQALEEEQKRLETLSKELKDTDDTDEVKKAVLEDQLITMEYRVINEINLLTREAASAELLENNAKILRGWVEQEIKLLEANEGPHRQRAHEIARALRREEQRLIEIAAELPKAESLRRIAILEVELRAIEVRLYEALRELHFHPTTGSPKPSTHSGTHTARPTTGHATRATARPTTARATVRPTTGHATARPTVRPSTVHHTVKATTKAAVTAH